MPQVDYALCQIEENHEKIMCILGLKTHLLKGFVEVEIKVSLMPVLMHSVSWTFELLKIIFSTKPFYYVK